MTSVGGGTWTIVGTHALGGRTIALSELVAAGGETSVTVSLDASNTGIVFVRRITGHDAATSQSEVVFSSGSGTTPDPGTITPTGGSDDYLYIASCGWNDNETASAYPSGYSGGITDSTSALNIGAANAYLGTTGSSSENPGTFTRASSTNWECATTAVSPSAAEPHRRRELLRH